MPDDTPPDWGDPLEWDLDERDARLDELEDDTANDPTVVLVEADE